jgi:hypothetical protein
LEPAEDGEVESSSFLPSFLLVHQWAGSCIGNCY